MDKNQVLRQVLADVRAVVVKISSIPILCHVPE